MRVRSGADSHREEAAASEVRANEGEELRFIADLTVGHEDHLAHSRFVRRYVAKRSIERRHHLGPASRP